MNNKTIASDILKIAKSLSAIDSRSEKAFEDLKNGMEIIKSAIRNLKEQHMGLDGKGDPKIHAEINNIRASYSKLSQNWFDLEREVRTSNYKWE